MFYVGGLSASFPKGYAVKTAVSGPAASKEDIPRIWSLRFTHPCRDINARFWDTDIVLERSDASTRIVVSIVVSCRMLSNYIGAEPPAPVVTTPAIVSRLIEEDRLWKALAGNERLHTHIVMLEPGHGRDLVSQVLNPQRSCPIVLATCRCEDSQVMIDARALAGLLSGVAVVYVSPSAATCEELRYFLDPELACSNGRVRIFMPIRSTVARDGKRHRYFTPYHIEQIGADEVVNQIAHGLVRRGKPQIPISCTSLDDVIRRVTYEERMQRIVADKEGSLKEEVLALLAEEQSRSAEIEKQCSELQELLDMAESYNGQLLAEKSQLADEMDGLKKQAADMRYRLAAAQGGLQRLAGKSRDLDGLAEHMMGMDALPKTLADVMRLIEKVFGNEIEFADRAWKSAEESTFADMQSVYQGLRAMATVLHSLHFAEDNPGFLPKTFQERTGFELALTEGSATKQHPEFSSMRRVIHRGREYEVFPHVKVDSRGEHLRIYYAPDNEREVLVVGHCGDHLDTYGTQRRKDR